MINRYFDSYADYFWQWEENNSIVAIPNGRTIIYKQSLEKTLDVLKHAGLPNFGSLLLCQIALNSNPESDIEQVFEILRGKDISKIYTDVQEARKFLKVLSEVPVEHKREDTKLVLLKGIFLTAHNLISHQKSEKINELSRGRIVAKSNGVLNANTIRKDIRPLALLYRKFPTPASILSFLHNVPHLNEELILDNSESTSGDILDQLISHHETAKIGSLIKRIWSAINIPLQSVIPSQQPTGGVADLSNKGDLDKLLISEYANDDLIFLSRLANNEVLYLNRESPPSNNEYKRTILIDISLRNWGTPKIISFATALAILNHPKNKVNCDIFLVGKTYQKIDLSSLNEIVQAIQKVDVSLHCSEGIQSFFEDHESSKSEEIFLLSEIEFFNNIENHSVLSEFRSSFNYWLLSDYNGTLDVFKNTNKSKKHVQTIKLPLEELWKTNKKERPSESKNQHDSHFPIYLKNPDFKYGVKITSDGRVYSISKNKSLLCHYYNKGSNFQKGWDVIKENIPITDSDWEIIRSDDGELILVCFQSNIREITLLNISTSQSKKVKFNNWQSRTPQSFIANNGHFYWGIQRRGFQLDFNGKLIPHNTDYSTFYHQRKKELSELTSEYRMNYSVLKNVRNAGINSSGQLFLNNNTLILKEGQHFRFSSGIHVGTKVIHAKMINEDTFKFSDNSTIRINKTGIIILKSSNPNIPKIYFPSVITGTLGLQAENKFSGNQYYRKENLYEISIDKPHQNKLSMTKLVKVITGFGLKESKEFVDSEYNIIPFRFTEFMLKEARKALDDSEFQYSIIKLIELPIKSERLSSISFQSLYLKPFLNTIINYGA